eukprot:TRINITY_DN11574_c0_g2_i2.p1 TRINITY_DN11574_c0_g2~~TRINITY_DN11574_c0_g2_i2.p1  ORF type:complete len:180 (-),score=26.88 TRINITY_DN11574_c0_g2_i2:58-597(-)
MCIRDRWYQRRVHGFQIAAILIALAGFTVEGVLRKTMKANRQLLAVCYLIVSIWLCLALVSAFWLSRSSEDWIFNAANNAASFLEHGCLTNTGYTNVLKGILEHQKKDYEKYYKQFGLLPISIVSAVYLIFGIWMTLTVKNDQTLLPDDDTEIKKRPILQEVELRDAPSHHADAHASHN